jgi:hypothetical protein
MTINTIYGRHSIPCICNDTFSYPEKVMFGALEQLELNFEYHKTFEWSKNVQVDNKNLCGNKEYDFSFKYNNEEFLLETHGSQHYDKSKFSTMKGSRSFGEEISNDKLKKELAIKNSIKEENYIIIDCRNKYLKWIKQNILESKLNEIFDLNNVDWIEVEKFASNNLVKVACDYKNNNPQLFTGDISKMMNICQGTVTRYLKKGNKLGWCHYDINEEKVRNSEIQSLRLGKLVKCIDINKTFNSLSDCSKYFKDSLNIKLFSNCIGMVCNENLESYKGYHFVFV